MRKKKSTKQLLREQETARRKKFSEIDAEYELMAKSWRDQGFETISPVPEKEEWIGQRQEEWNRQQPLIITGKYNDKEKIDAEYQQKFVEYVRQLCPEIIEELRVFIPLFDELFKENKDNFLAFFDWYKINLIDLDQSLDNYINSFNPYFPYLEFRPYENQKFRYDYKWGEHRVLLNFLYLMYLPAEKEVDAEILQDTLQLLHENLVFHRNYPKFPTQFDEVKLQNFRQNESMRILKEFLINQKDSYFASAVNLRLPENLQKILSDDKPNVEAFITLKIQLLRWAKMHNLEKDWLLKYAYDFLKQFSDKPNLKVSDIQVGYLQVRSLVAFPFEFKFNGWIPGDEEKEKFEIRLKESFESSLEGYFQNVGGYLHLEKIKKVTKPLDYDRVKWLVRWTVQGWNKEKILDDIDKDFQEQGIEKSYDIRTVEYALKQFKRYNLPVRK